MAAPASQAIDYSRTEQTSFARAAVRELKILIVGAGAIGNEVVKALGLLGCGEVVIIDGDTVARHNLTRSVLLRTEDAIGRNKAIALVNRCRHYFPDTVWAAVGTEIADAGAACIARSDLIFSCVDNELARLEIAYLCAKLNRPLCDGGLGAEDYSKVRVSFFPGRESASFCCLLPPARRRELLTSWDGRRSPCWADAEPATAAPGTPMTAAIAGSMQAEMGLRLLLAARRGEAGVAQSVEFTLDPPQLATIKIRRASGCPFHEELPGACMFEADADLTVAELLGRAGRDRSGEPMLILDWPICVSARCRDCRYLWNPVVRVARFHHSGVCPRCHSRRLTACRTIHRLGKASEFADYRLRALGMPASNLYTIEFQRSGLQ